MKEIKNVEFQSLTDLQALLSDRLDDLYEIKNTGKYQKLSCKKCKKYSMWFIEDSQTIKLFRTINQNHDIDKHKEIQFAWFYFKFIFYF